MSFSKDIPLEWLPAYIQGFGRSLWYTTKGNFNKVTKIIDAFDEKYQKHLWRGLGVAIAYVGGLSQEEWEKIQSSDAFEHINVGFILAFPFLKNIRSKGFMIELFHLDESIDCNDAILRKISKNGTDYLKIIKETIS